MDTAAAALEAESERRGSKQEACGREGREEGCRPYKAEAFGRKKCCCYQETAAEKPTEKKPTTEEKKPAT